MRLLIPLFIWMITTVTVPTKMTQSEQNVPSSINSTEVQSLKNDLTRLQVDINGFRGRQDWWNTGYLRLAIAAAIFGVLAALLVIFSWIFQNKASNLERDARPKYDELSKKEERLRLLENQESEYQIQRAQALAEEARQKAGKTERENIALKGSLDREIEEAKGRAEELRAQNDKTEDNLVAANRQIESERLKRVKLAASLLPRHVFDQSGLISRLSSMKPHRILFVYPDESEPRSLAEQIAFIFSSLGWPLWGKQIKYDLPEGLHVGFGMKMPTLTQGRTVLDTQKANRQKTESERFAASIALALSDAGLDASKGFSEEGTDQNPSTLIIEVGAKTNRELEEALQELGVPKATPLASGVRAGGNRILIPKDPPPEIDDSHP